MYRSPLLLLSLPILALSASLPSSSPSSPSLPLDPSGHTIVYYALKYSSSLDRAACSLLQRLPPRYQLQVLYDASLPQQRSHLLQRSRFLRLARTQDRRFALTPVPPRFFAAAKRYARRHIVNALNLEGDFWREIVVGETLVLFQHDAAMCGAAARGLEEFEEFSMVGAPWKGGLRVRELVRRKEEDSEEQEKVSTEIFVGNGGASLRSRAFMLRCLEEFRVPEGIPEDVYFGLCMRQLSGKDAEVRAPTLEDAGHFAAETEGAGRPLFLHQYYGIGSRRVDDATAMLEFCPESVHIAAPMAERCLATTGEVAGLGMEYGLAESEDIDIRQNCILFMRVYRSAQLAEAWTTTPSQ